MKEKIPASRGLMGVVMLLVFLCGASNSGNGQESKTPDGENTLKQAKEAAPDAARKKPAPNEAKNCLSAGCHDTLASLKWVHGPVSAGACDTCHKQTAPQDAHRFELTRPSEKLCTHCHLESSPKEGMLAHAPFAESDCLTCHNPHGGKTRAMVKAETTAKLCEACHSLPKQRITHKPVSEGECLVCHTPHFSERQKLLRVGSREMCLTCHAETASLLAEASYVHGPAAVECLPCHEAHGGDLPSFLRDQPKNLCLTCHDSVEEGLKGAPVVHGAMSADEGCTACHTPHASNYRSQLQAELGQLCFKCHNKQLNAPSGRKVRNIKNEIASAKFPHGPLKEGDCQGCHFSHSSSHTNLLKGGYSIGFYNQFSDSTYEFCFNCHEKALTQDEKTVTLTGFRDNDRNLHFLHVNRKKGRSCRACHATHASNLPKHIRQSVPFGKGGWMLPINFKKTPEGGTCTPGCHREASYNNTGP